MEELANKVLSAFLISRAKSPGVNGCLPGNWRRGWPSHLTVVQMWWHKPWVCFGFLVVLFEMGFYVALAVLNAVDSGLELRSAS